MSETTTPGPAEGVDTTPAPAPEPAPSPAPAPAPEGDAPDTPEQTPEQAAEAKSRGDRRFAELTAKLSARERDLARVTAEADFLRRSIPQQPDQPETPEQQYRRLEDHVRAQVETKIRTETFHEQGRSQFPDWQQRCADLMGMGADAGFAQLLVEMPEGVKVAAALAGDPAEVERIAGLRSERARAIALGKYAATVEDGPAARVAAPRPATQAPAPVRPVTGRAAPQFNEYSATAEALVDKYMRDNIERQQRRH